MNPLTRAAAITLLAATPAWAQGKLDAQTLKAFGGTYMLDCANNASPKATVFADALVVLNGDRRVAGSQLEAAASFYGPNQPPEYRTVLLSEAPGGQLRVAIFQDKAGYYLMLDPDPKVQAAIGKSFGQQKFRRCDGGASRPVQASAPQKKYALHELSASGLLLDPKAKAAYFKALGPLAREPWLARLDGPSPENKRVSVGGANYVQLGVCKNHDCQDNSALFLYSVERNVLYGFVYMRGKAGVIGAPPPPVAAEMQRIWKREWRKQ